MIKETWDWIPNYEGIYKASTHGRIRSVTRLIYHPINGWMRRKGEQLSLKSKSRGRIVVGLCKEGKEKQQYVHRLVLLTFVGPRPKGKDGLHRDDNKDNNHLSNLYYGTPRQNWKDAVQNGLSVIGRKHWEHVNSSLSKFQILKVKRLYKSGDITQKDLAIKFKVHPCTIYRTLKRAKCITIPD